MNAPAAVHHFTDPSTNRQFIGRVLRRFVWELSMAFDPNRRISGLWAARRLLEEALVQAQSVSLGIGSTLLHS